MAGSNFLAPLANEQQQLIAQTFLTAYKRGADDYATQKAQEYETAKQKMADEAQMAKENAIQSGENARAQAAAIDSRHKEMLGSFSKAISDLTTVAGNVASNLESPNMDSSSHAAGQDLRQNLGKTLTQLGPAMASILSSDDYKGLPKEAQDALGNISGVISSYKAPQERQVSIPAYGNAPAQTVSVAQLGDLNSAAGLIHTYVGTQKEAAEAAKASAEAAGGQGALKPEQVLKNQDDLLGAQSKFVNHRDYNTKDAPKLAAIGQLEQQLGEAKSQRESLIQQASDPTLSDDQKMALRKQAAALPDITNGFTGTIGGVPLSFIDDKDFAQQKARLTAKAQSMENGTGGYSGATTDLVNRVLRGDADSLPQFQGAKAMLNAARSQYDINTPEGVEKWIGDTQLALRSPNASDSFKQKAKNTLAVFGVTPDPNAPLVPYQGK